MGISSCRELLAVEYGSELQTRINESDVTVGTSAIAVVAGNGARIQLILSNTGATTIYVSSLSSITGVKGLQLNAGGFLSFSWKNDTDLSTVSFYAIGSAGGGTLHVIENILTGS
jgi:hypothetical protein